MANWRLRSVRVLTFEGIGPNAPQVELIDLSPGINLLWAPNRRGKSCTARAIKVAMANDKAAASGSWVILEYAVDDGPGSQYTYNSDTKSPPSELPAGFFGAADRYQLALYDLLLTPGTELAQALLEELYGGVNLDEIAAQLGLGITVPRYTVPADNYVKAYKRFDKLSCEHEEVRRKSETLASIRLSLQAVQDKLRVGAHLQLVRDYLVAGDALRAAEAKLSEYPDEELPILTALGVDAPAVLRERIKTWTDLQSRIVDSRNGINDRRSALEENPFGVDGALPESTQLERLEQGCADLQEAANDLKNARTALADQETLASRAGRAATEAVDAVTALRETESSWPDEASLSRAIDACRHAEGFSKQLDELKLTLASAGQQRSDALARSTSILSESAVEAWLARNVAAPQISDAGNAHRRQHAAAVALDETEKELADARSELESQSRAGDVAAAAVPLLRNWLNAFDPGEGNATSSGGGWLSYLLAAVAVIFAVLLAFLVHPGFWGAVLVAVVMAVMTFVKSKQEPGKPGDNPPVSLPQGVTVDAWTFADVHRALATQLELASACADLQKTVIRLEERCSERQKKLNAEKKLAAAAVAELVDRIGASAAEVDPSQIDELTASLRELRTGDNACKQINAKIVELKQQSEDKLQEVCAAVPSLIAGDEPADPATMNERLERTKGRCAKLVEKDKSAAGFKEKAREASDKVKELADGVDKLEAAWTQALVALREAFGVWTDAGAVAELATAGEFRALLGELRADAQNCRTARSEIDSSTETIEKLQPRLADAAQKVDSWFADYGFPTGAEHWQGNHRRLERLEKDLAEFKDDQKEAENAGRDLQILLDKLERNHVPTAMRELTTADLDAREDELQELREEAKRLNDKITETNTLVDQLCDASALEEADADVEEALDEVRAMRRRVIAAEAGGRVLEKLKQRFLRDNSTTLDEASRLLNDFSGGSYELSLATTQPPKLVAKHVARSEDGVPQALDQLSSNTRVQSLMAARLAFLHTQEREWGGMRLPLIVDEALAIADPEGSHSVMEALAREAQAGRQILYFTAQPNEIRQWQTFFAEPSSAEYPQPIIHDGLGTVTELLAEAVTANWAPTPLPEPADGEGLDEYLRKLSVPILDPWMEDPVTAAHVCYLVDNDPKQLHQLATCCRTIGELNAWLTRLGKDLQPLQARLAGEDCGALVEVWGRREAILRDVVELWRQGRVPKLTPDVLRETADIRATWKERAEEIIKTVNGDPVEFLKKFAELPRMRQRTADEIKERLHEHGLLPEGDPLDQNDVYQELLRRYPEAEQEVRIVFPRLQHLWPPE